MQLYIFDGQTEALQAVLSLQDGGGESFYSGIHDDRLNQDQTLTFSIPADHPDAQYVVEGGLAAFKDLDGNFQLFEITILEGDHTDALVKTATAEHAYVELLDEFIEDLNVTSEDASTALSSILSGTRWSVGTVTVTGINSNDFKRKNVIAAIQTLIGVWGGELQFRVEISGNVITNRYVDLFAERGSVTGKRFEYGNDMVEIKQTSDITQIKTALYGYGQTDSSNVPLDFSSVTWSTANGDPVDKPGGQTWVGDPTALAQWGRANGTRHRKDSWTDSSCTDAATLLQETWTQLQKVKDPKVTYATRVVDLERITGYSWEAVRLGDTVYVIDRSFQPALQLQARVIEIRRDLVRYENTQVTLGNFLPRLTDSQKTIANLTSTVNQGTGYWGSKLSPGDAIDTSWLQGVIDVLKTQFQDTNGYVYDSGDGNGILVLDKRIDQNPTKAFKIGGGEFAIANSQTNGNWNWTTFGTGDGFTADLLIAGAIQASKVTIKGDASFYWTGSNLYVVDPSDANNQIRIGKYDGANYGIAFTTDGGTTWIESMNFSGILGSAIQANSIFAYQLVTADTTNLSQINEDLNPQGYTVVTSGGYKYFQLGTGQWTQLNLAYSKTLDFKVGDKYYFGCFGYVSAATYALGSCIRYYYTDGTWADAGSSNLSTPTSDGAITGVVAITSAPDQTKTVDHVQYFFQKDDSNADYAYLRNIELRHVIGNALVDNLNAEKITTGSLSGIEVDLSDGTGNNTAKLTGGKVQTYTANYASSGWNITQTTDGSGMNFSANNGSSTDNGNITFVAGNAGGILAGPSAMTGIQTYNDRVWTNNSTVDNGTGTMTVGGDFYVSGTKSSVVKTKSYGRQTLYAVEAPENWFMDIRDGVVGADGQTSVELDAIFGETIDTSEEPLKVLVQGVGAQVELVSRSASSFAVKGPPGTEFIYQVVGRRVDVPDLRFNPAAKAPDVVEAYETEQGTVIRWVGHPAHRFHVYQNGRKLTTNPIDQQQYLIPRITKNKQCTVTVTSLDHKSESSHSAPIEVSMKAKKRRKST